MHGLNSNETPRLGAHQAQKGSMSHTVPVHFLFYSNSKVTKKNPTQASAGRRQVTFSQPTTRVREHTYLPHHKNTTHTNITKPKTVSVMLTEMVSLKLILFFSTALQCRILPIGCYFLREQGSSALQMHPWSPGRNLQQTAKMSWVFRTLADLNTLNKTVGSYDNRQRKINLCSHIWNWK